MDHEIGTRNEEVKLSCSQSGVDESGIDQDGGADPTGACPIDADPTVAIRSDADPNDAGLSYAGDTGFSNKVDDIPTQQSKASDTAKMIEDVIATGKILKTWDVDDVLAE
ncbi:hypothetical protein Tco_1027005 [Tanacetum coccineum]